MSDVRQKLIQQCNEAPEPLRSYIQDLETSDRTSLIQEIYGLREALFLAEGAIKIIKNAAGNLVPERKTMDLVVLDLEMNQPSNKIIQIGYVIGDSESGTIRCIKSLMVNPGEPLSPDIIKLTGITQEQVDSGMPLEAAYQELKRDITEQREQFGRPIFMNPVTWGGNDIGALQAQLGIANDPLFGRRWIDAKTLFVSWAIANGKKPMGGLAQSMRKLGLRFHGRKHNACDDALNTLLIYRRLLEFFKG